MRVSPNVSGTAGQLIRHDAARPEGVPRDVGWPTAREPPRLLRSAQHQSKGRGKQGASGQAASMRRHKARQPGREPVPGVMGVERLEADDRAVRRGEAPSGVLAGARRIRPSALRLPKGRSRLGRLEPPCLIGTNERLELRCSKCEFLLIFCVWWRLYSRKEW